MVNLTPYWLVPVPLSVLSALWWPWRPLQDSLSQQLCVWAHPAFPSLCLSTTNDPSIPPPPHPIPSPHPASVAGHSLLLSLSFWVLQFAIELLSGHRVRSIVCFQHSSPFPHGISRHILLGVPFSIWDDFPLACEAGFQAPNSVPPNPSLYNSWVLVFHYVILYSIDECNLSMSVPLFLTHFT